MTSNGVDWGLQFDSELDFESVEMVLTPWDILLQKE